MSSEIGIWLVTTDHLEDGLWFLEESDFKVGMNYVAAIASGSRATIPAFILMSNHVHFVIKGTEKDAEAFINEFKRRYSKYLMKRYGISKHLKNNGVDIKIIPYSDEAPERVVAYVHMNCVAANICSHPAQYPWGSGNCLFNPSAPRGRRFDSMSERECRRILHSKAAIPGQWLLCDEGYILPQSYVDVKFSESIFRTPKRMDYFYRNSSKARLRINSDESIPSFKDQTVLNALPELCRALFHVMSFQELSDAKKTEILRQLRYRFSSNVHQLARITGLSYDQTAALLDTH